MSNKVQITKDEIEYKGVIFDIHAQTIVIPEADMTIHRQVMHTSNSVTIALINQDSKILITKEFRSAVGDFTWALPAGRIDPNEEANIAAQRELAEETGLLVNLEDFTQVDAVNLSEGVMDEKSYIFLVQLTDTNHSIVKQKLDSDEYIAKSKWVTLDEAYCHTNAAATHIALNHIQINQLKREYKKG